MSSCMWWGALEAKKCCSPEGSPCFSLELFCSCPGAHSNVQPRHWLQDVDMNLSHARGRSDRVKNVFLACFTSGRATCSRADG